MSIDAKGEQAMPMHDKRAPAVLAIGWLGAVGCSATVDSEPRWDVAGWSCAESAALPVDTRTLNFVEPSEAQPGARVTYSASMADVAGALAEPPEALESASLDGNLAVLCWDGSDWVQVWSIFSSASEPIGDLPTPPDGELVEPAVSADVPFELEARVPAALPPGAYVLRVTARIDAEDGRESIDLTQPFRVTLPS